MKKDKIETYIPCEETLMERNGIKKKLRRPVINSLMFFRSTVCRALEVQRQFTNKVILYTRQKGLKRLPLAIPDREMNIFMLVTSSGEQGMEYFGEDNSKFQQGERVRVIDGKFKGAEGVICLSTTDRARLRKSSKESYSGHSSFYRICLYSHSRLDIECDGPASHFVGLFPTSPVRLSGRT